MKRQALFPSKDKIKKIIIIKYRLLQTLSGALRVNVS